MYIWQRKFVFMCMNKDIHCFIHLVKCLIRDTPTLARINKKKEKDKKKSGDILHIPNNRQCLLFHTRRRKHRRRMALFIRTAAEWWRWRTLGHPSYLPRIHGLKDMRITQWARFLRPHDISATTIIRKPPGKGGQEASNFWRRRGSCSVFYRLDIFAVKELGSRVHRDKCWEMKVWMRKNDISEEESNWSDSMSFRYCWNYSFPFISFLYLEAKYSIVFGNFLHQLVYRINRFL